MRFSTNWTFFCSLSKQYQWENLLKRIIFARNGCRSDPKDRAGEHTSMRLGCAAQLLQVRNRVDLVLVQIFSIDFFYSCCLFMLFNYGRFCYVKLLFSFFL